MAVDHNEVMYLRVQGERDANLARAMRAEFDVRVLRGVVADFLVAHNERDAGLLVQAEKRAREVLAADPATDTTEDPRW